MQRNREELMWNERSVRENYCNENRCYLGVHLHMKISGRLRHEIRGQRLFLFLFHYPLTKYSNVHHMHDGMMHACRRHGGSFIVQNVEFWLSSRLKPWSEENQNSREKTCLVWTITCVVQNAKKEWSTRVVSGFDRWMASEKGYLKGHEQKIKTLLFQ